MIIIQRPPLKTTDSVTATGQETSITIQIPQKDLSDGSITRGISHARAEPSSRFAAKTCCSASEEEEEAEEERRFSLLGVAATAELGPP